jgi:hypothetical protein
MQEALAPILSSHSSLPNKLPSAVEGTQIPNPKKKKHNKDKDKDNPNKNQLAKQKFGSDIPLIRLLIRIAKFCF